MFVAELIGATEHHRYLDLCLGPLTSARSNSAIRRDIKTSVELHV